MCKIEYLGLFKKMLFILLFFLPSTLADRITTIKNQPIQPHNPRIPQYKMLHMRGELNDETFSLFKNLNGLEIDRRAISYLTPGTFKKTHLEILDVHDNIEFPTVSAATFEYLKNLKVFRFTFNPYTDIEEGAFAKLKHLDVLVISHQNFKNVTKAFLEGLDTLKELSLTFNEIEYVEKDSFEHMKELTAVYLGNNFIKTITPGTFKNQLKLEDLQLQNNQLGNEENSFTVDWKTFDRIVTLQSLNIAKNHLRYVNVKDLVTTFPLLTSVNFLPNSLTCPSELHITNTMRHYGIQIEYYGNDHSNCKKYDLIRLGAVVFDD